MDIIEIGTPENLHFRIEWDENKEAVRSQCFVEIRFGNNIIISQWVSKDGKNKDSRVRMDLEEFVEELEYIKDKIWSVPDLEQLYLPTENCGFYQPYIYFYPDLKTGEKIVCVWGEYSLQNQMQFQSRGFKKIPWDDFEKTVNQLRELIDQKLASLSSPVLL